MIFKSRICVIGDLHFKHTNLVEANALADSIVKNIPDDTELVVLLGDVLDNHANVHSQAFNVAYGMIAKIASRHEIAILVGNHDYINNSQYCTAEHPFNVFKHWRGRITVVDRPTRWVNSNADRDHEQFALIPYVPPGRFVEAVSTLKDWMSVKCIFAHQEFSGIMFKDQGDMWPLDYPPVISGHIHDRVQLQPNVLYIGTPIQHSFAENTDKGISVFGPEGERRFPLSLPLKQTIEASVDDLESLVVPENTNLRLMLKTSTTEYQAFKKTKKFKELVAAKIKIVPVPADQQAMTDQLKQMVKTRRTYMDALTESVATNGSKYMKQAFETVMQSLR